MRWFWRFIAEQTVGHVFSTYVLPFLWPIGAPIMTALLGYYAKPEIPWMYIWATTVFVFAMANGGALWFSQILYQNRIKDKLNFLSVITSRNIRGDGVLIGIRVKSIASVPMEFSVENIRTRVGNRVPDDANHSVASFSIPAEGVGWFNDNVIDIGVPPSPGTLEGFIECTVKYGKPGNLKYQIPIKKQVVLAFNNDGLLERGYWNDAA